MATIWIVWTRAGTDRLLYNYFVFRSIEKSSERFGARKGDRDITNVQIK